ncbi:MAG: hypothetical protein IKU17_02930 [Clostridia bacterium]|nr:hypothetical protein [Clostridia bacterium]
MLPEFSAKAICEKEYYRVHPDGKGGYIRSFFDEPRGLQPYAVAVYDFPNKRITVDYLESGARCVSEISNSFAHIAWEALLMHENRMMLHSACVETPLGGLLFTGVSGAGKSTQAALWCEHGGGRLINGDRTILHKEENGWVGYGSPYAGSSKCYVNEGIGVRAIVAVKKADKNEVRRLSLKEAFRTVYSGLTVNTWDREFVSKACDFALELVSEVPVYELACTPDRGAVEALQAVLGKEECI